MRERLPDRRYCESFVFQHEGHNYRATASRFDDGRLAELFLDVPGKYGTALQANASTARRKAEGERNACWTRSPRVKQNHTHEQPPPRGIHLTKLR
jgi:hypothetical protein